MSDDEDDFDNRNTERQSQIRISFNESQRELRKYVKKQSIREQRRSKARSRSSRTSQIDTFSYDERPRTSHEHNRYPQ